MSPYMCLIIHDEYKDVIYGDSMHMIKISCASSCSSKSVNPVENLTVKRFELQDVTKYTLRGRGCFAFATSEFDAWLDVGDF